MAARSAMRSAMLPLIVGCRGTQLSKRERACFEDLSPAGFILFSHNIKEPSQTRDLCAALREAASARAPRARTAILVDQEGGRVQRLRPPHWRRFPAARAFGDYWQNQDKAQSKAQSKAAAIEACRASARLMGEELAELGITVDCAPVADLPSEDGDPIIGDRAFSSSIEGVQCLARAQAEGLLDAGILPVVKHVPGHGRATCDSHKALPSVGAMRGDLAKSDFACFLALRDLPMMMTAHILYNDIDGLAPATLSKKMIESVVRREIGFEGLLISDDLRMKALQGSQQQLALKALNAGCDLPLYCGSSTAVMHAIAQKIDESSAKPSAALVSANSDKKLEQKLNKALTFAARRKKTFSPKERENAENLLAEVLSHNSARV